MYVDPALCDKHGQCVLAAPAVFRWDDQDELQYEAEPSDAHAEEVAEAALLCPTLAVQVTDG